MNIKKLLLSALLLTTTGFAYAEDTTDFIKIDDCIIVAGVDDVEEGIIDIKLENASSWCALQFDLYLPEGVEFGLYDGALDFLPDETRFQKFKVGRVDHYFSTDCVKQDDGAYRFIAYNDQNQAIFDSEDKCIFKVRLIASDQANTGTYTAQIKNAIVSNSVDTSTGSAVVTGANCPIKDSSFKIQINAKVGKGGYGTFSWPRDVDFSTDENVEEVYTASGAPVNGWLHLTPIANKKVPAGTGVFIKGAAGTIVNPETTSEEVASVTSSLGETSSAPYEAGSNVFALATKNGKTALYPVSEGVVIPQYKAYMTSADGAKLIAFDDTATGINAMDMDEEEGDIFNLGGQKVQKTTMKGVYIKNGKKVVVK